MMIRMWKIAHTVPATMCSSDSAMPPTDSAKAPPSIAISRKISSPAYMLPNSRMPCETVLDTYSTSCIADVGQRQERKADPGQRIGGDLDGAERRDVELVRASRRGP